ncbi:MAG: class I tRNA ligase family protein [Planctomycetia bacterium]|nr:class I tRNA ligase family protein [Planctomycetia bacterium]
MTELAKQYEPKEAQAKWFSFWEERGYFDANPPSQQADPAHPKKPHTIMIPLPNVTGALHMGHALNGTLQDLLTRWRRMQGYEALWMPGTDHAGIATQAVVERRMLEEEKLTRHDVGREALVERIWKWKDKFEERIISQQKMLGASCDWRRVRFTLDDVCSRAVRRTFFKFFSDGLIYRGKRLVNWDTYLQTAVADDEVTHEDVAGHFWTFNYPIVIQDAADREGEAPAEPSSVQPALIAATARQEPRPPDGWQPTGERISFSTTRPETMLGDTAVCVHPTDERYTHLVGKHVRIPLTGRVIPIIADALLVDKTLGTGCVKVTPAHDPNDYACYQRNKQIGVINILNPDGTLNEHGGQYAGLTMFAARERVVADMQSLGHFEKVEDRTIPLMHSDRSKTPIEPYLSDQWFVKMDTLAEAAMQAVRDGKVKFFPSRYTTSYMDWLGEKRDWCISRQLWWGHRIPVWKKTFLRPADETDEQKKVVMDALRIALDDGCHLDTSHRELDSGETEMLCLVCIDDGRPDLESRFEEQGFKRDEDVLDTWFSSALWPHATLGWPNSTENPPTISRSETELNPAVEAADFKGVPVSPFALAMIPESVARKLNILPVSLDTDGLTIASIAIKEPEVSKFSHELGCKVKWMVASNEEIAAAIDRVYSSSPSPLSPQPSAKNQVLSYFYPGNVLVTSRDIITLWVARMVLTGLYNMGEVPFRHVCIHPKILDGFGQTMSKSKGNGVDPLDLIDKYGTDAVRFTIASFAGETQDVRLPVGYECPHCGNVIPQTLEHQKAVPGGGAKPRVKCAKCKQSAQYSSPWFEPDAGEPVARVVSERFEYGRNFCNKLWNAARFAMMNLEGYTPGEVRSSGGSPESSATSESSADPNRRAACSTSDLKLEDQWILSRLSHTSGEVTSMLGRYRFDEATRILRDFVWNEFCDWYLEMIKPRLRDDAMKPIAQRILVSVLDTIVRLLHPFAPFITEELWQRLNEIAPVRGLVAWPLSAEGTQATTSVMTAPWPDVPTSCQNRDLERRFERLQETIVAVRNVRALYSISPSTPIQLHIRCNAGIASEMHDVAAQFENLSKALLAAAGADVQPPTCSASFSLTDADVFVPLEGLIDRDAERARNTKEAERLRKGIESNEKKLQNEAFVAKAPPDVLQQTRDTLDNYKNQLASVEAIIKALE